MVSFLFLFGFYIVDFVQNLKINTKPIHFSNPFHFIHYYNPKNTKIKPFSTQPPSNVPHHHRRRLRPGAAAAAAITPHHNPPASPLSRGLLLQLRRRRQPRPHDPPLQLLLLRRRRRLRLPLLLAAPRRRHGVPAGLRRRRQAPLRCRQSRREFGQGGTEERGVQAEQAHELGSCSFPNVHYPTRVEPFRVSQLTRVLFPPGNQFHEFRVFFFSLNF